MNWLKRLFSVRPEHPPMRFYNSLGKSLQDFALYPGSSYVRMYNCGPTVYDRQHIGNLSAAVFADTLRRAIEFNGMQVKQVINITDFGHLVSDADEGEDKMTKGLKREKMPLTMENMREFATRYMNIYLEDIKTLNVATEKIQFPRASDYVPAMIAMIKTLEEKGYAYKIKDGVYFDTAHFPSYGALGGISEGQEAGARVMLNEEKRSPHDFALWKSVSSRSKLGWQSPWGRGFPGWHLECSAMIHSILGDQIDIHTGGIEHIAIHHNNEIAQSEASTGKKPLSRFWLHREHIRMNNTKLAKSTGNTAYLSDVIEKGIHPFAVRYWFLTAHYRQPANFTWEALEASQKAYLRLRDKYYAFKDAPSENAPAQLLSNFRLKLNDDLDTPGALASVWEALNAGTYSDGQLFAFLNTIDEVLGLGLSTQDEMLKNMSAKKESVTIGDLPQEIKALYEKRIEARTSKDWKLSDELREEMLRAGYVVKDTGAGSEIFKA